MKQCKCGADLTTENTTGYRLKNYIYKCNNCVNKEKREQASEYRANDPEKYNDRSQKFRCALKKKDPVKYTCTQMRSSAVKRAKAYGYDLDITTDYLISISPVNCPVFNKPLKYGGGEKTSLSASLDRIDSNKGYTVDNVQVISNMANMMKNAATDDELIMFSKWAMRTVDKKNGNQTDSLG